MKKIVLVFGVLSMFLGGINASAELGPEPVPVMERVGSRKLPFFKMKETPASIQARQAWSKRKSERDAVASASAQGEREVTEVLLKDFIQSTPVDAAENPQKKTAAGNPLPVAQKGSESAETPQPVPLLTVSSSETDDPVQSPVRKKQKGVRILQSSPPGNQSPQSEEDSFSGENPGYLEGFFNNPSSRSISFRDKASGGVAAACALAVYVSHDFRAFKSKARRSGRSAITFKTYCAERLNDMTKTELVRAVVVLAAAGLLGTALHHVLVSDGGPAPAA